MNILFLFNHLSNLLAVSIENAAFLAALIALISFIYTSKRQREIEKNSMYQQLELASIDFMKWETENIKEITRVRKELDENKNVSEEDQLILETRCFQTLNLFELCIHNAGKRTLPDKVFGSWLTWIHEFANEPEFKKIWPEINTNYIPECRKVINYAMGHTENKFIEEICKIRKYKLAINEWIKPVLDTEKQDNKIQESDINVDIKKATLKNIEKYLSIFKETKHDAYISHGEVLCGRATHDFKWAENINSQMKQEFIYYIFHNKKYPMFEILVSGELIGFAIIEINKKTNSAILSDIMIKKTRQSKGTGKKTLIKIENYLKNKGIDILLLESGIKNKKAHDFFEKNGFTEISVEYSKNLR